MVCLGLHGNPARGLANLIHSRLWVLAQKSKRPPAHDMEPAKELEQSRDLDSTLVIWGKKFLTC